MVLKFSMPEGGMSEFASAPGAVGHWAGRPPTVERRSERISWHAKIASKRVGVVS